MKIAVIQGGPSTEAAVSRESAACVHRALIEKGHDAVLLELGAQLPGALLSGAFDVVFPVVHGAQGEDGCIQGLLEVMGLPYVGSDVRGSAISADKVASKVFFEREGLVVAGQRVLREHDLGEDMGELLSSLREQLGGRFIVKPARGGSTIGMTRLFSDAGPVDLKNALVLALECDPLVLIEEYVDGRELTCGVLQREGELVALPVTQITSQATEWYDFASKYAPGGSLHQCPAPLSPELTAQIQSAALASHRAVGARDLSRSDFIVDAKGRFVLLEINTIPGMTNVSLFPEAAAAIGISFAELTHLLVCGAQSRRCGPTLKAPPLPGR